MVNSILCRTAGRGSAEVITKYIIVDMYAKAVQSAATEYGLGPVTEERGAFVPLKP